MDILAHRQDTIAYRERAGRGPVLVCLHGIGSNAASFDPLVAALPDDWRVVAWNAPGYGGSAPLAAKWPVAADYAQALENFVAGLGLERFHLVGHSLGTLIAASYAIRHPGRLENLLLAACAQGHGAPRGGPLSAQAQARLDDLDRLGPEAFGKARAPRLLHRPDDRPEVLARVTRSMSEIRNPGYAAAVRMLASGDLARDAASIAVPTSILVGAEDVVTPPVQSRRVFDALPAAARRRYAELAGCGHALYLEDPAAFAGELKTAMEEEHHV